MAGKTHEESDGAMFNHDPDDTPPQIFEKLYKVSSLDQESRSHFSPKQQVLQLKMQLGAANQMAECIENLKTKWLLDMHDVLDGCSPLISLQSKNLLHLVVSNLDEVSLYQLEEASETVKERMPATKKQWEYLDSIRTNGRYSSDAQPDATLNGRAFAESYLFAEKMQSLANGHSAYKVIPVKEGTGTVHKECLGCTAYLNYMHRFYTHTTRKYQGKAFVHLSQLEEEGLRSIWCGFVDGTMDKSLGPASYQWKTCNIKSR
jgi:hypothetical protein